MRKKHDLAGERRFGRRRLPALFAPVGMLLTAWLCMPLLAGDETYEIEQTQPSLVGSSARFAFEPPDELERRKLADPDRIEIRYRPDLVIHPAPGIDPALLLDRQSSSAADPSGLRRSIAVIQFPGPIRREWRDQIESLGVRVEEYVQSNGYLVEIPDSAWEDLHAMLDNGVIRHVGRYPEDAKLDSRLAALSRDPLQSIDHEVLVRVFGELDEHQVGELEQSLSIERRLVPPLNGFRGQVATIDLDRLAALPFVMRVRLATASRLTNLEGSMSGGADRVVALGNYTGQGVRVAVVDTGIARTGPSGQCGASGADYHVDLPSSRIIDEWDGENGDLNACDDNGHGTHTAGTIAGGGDGDPAWKGLAPDADLLVYKECCDSDGFGFRHFDEVLFRAAVHGANVVGNSWGGGDNGGYNENSEWADLAVLGAWNGSGGQSWPMFLSVSAGNDNDLVKSPGSAKNVVTVGAMKDGNPTDRTSDCFCVNQSATNCGICNNKPASCSDDYWPPTEQICFSNFGPIDTDGDGKTRLKPDLVAPGTRITSPFPAYLNNGNPYDTKNGTSMSQPMVAGTAALMLSQFTDLADQPEMIKARMLATAVNLGDRTRFGHGMLDAHHAVYNSSSVQTLLWTGGTITGTGNDHFLEFTAPAGFVEIRVYLTWADQPGSEATAEVVNDLDLRVYDATGALVDASTRDDETVEFIRTSDGVAGEWLAQVRGFAVPEPDTRFGLIAIAIMKEPSLSITAQPASSCVRPGDDFQIDTTLANSGYSVVASQISVDLPDDLSIGVDAVTLLTEDVDRARHIASEDLWSQTTSNKYFVTVGEVNQSFSRSAEWHLTVDSSASDASKVVTIAGSAKFQPRIETVELIEIDGTPPGDAQNLGSASHPIGICTDDPNVTLTWDPAIDARCGLDGYGVTWSVDTPVQPPPTQDLAAGVTSVAYTLAFSDSPRYFSIRSVDVAGNWASTYESHGPIYIDQVPGPVSGLLLAKIGPDLGISWSVTPNANFYRVYRDSDPTFPSPTQVGSDIPAGTLSTIDPGAAVDPTTYYYKVVATNVCGLEGP